MGSADTFERLVGVLARLPGVGRRSAERMAMKLARDPKGLLKDLSLSLDEAARLLCACGRCGSLTSLDDNPCRLCTSPNRDGSKLCVVEDPSDIPPIERSGMFRGRYHALGGKLSPMRGDGPSDLRLSSLVERVAREKIEEVILALSTDVEGDATASLVADTLKGRGVQVTRLAYGLPAGSGIGYSDPITLARAFRGRVVEGRRSSE